MEELFRYRPDHSSPGQANRSRRSGPRVNLFYVLLVTDDKKVQLIKKNHQDEVILGKASFEFLLGDELELSLESNGNDLVGHVNGSKVLEATDNGLSAGSVGLIIDEGRTAVRRIEISPST